MTSIGWIIGWIISWIIGWIIIGAVAGWLQGKIMALRMLAGSGSFEEDGSE